MAYVFRPNIFMRLLGRLRPPSEPVGAAPMVLSYTPGKVGGTSVVQAMRQAGLEAHQVHSLRPKYLTDRAREAFDSGQLPLRHVSIAMALRRDLMNGQRDVRIFTGVRDPFDRLLSAFFENLHRRKDGLDKNSPPEALFATWIASTKNLARSNWFDLELKGQLGIDIFSQPFDKSARMALLPEHMTLVLRVDCEQTRKEAALSALVGRRVNLGHANVGKTKPYAKSYAAVQELARVPEALADEVYGSAFARHFWTDDERAVLANKWCARKA